MDYAADHARIVASLLPNRWPDLPGDDARAWEEIRLLLRAKISDTLGLDPLRAGALEERLIARIGSDWYREGHVAEVVALLADVGKG